MLSARLRPITAIPTTPICCFDIVYSCQGVVTAQDMRSLKYGMDVNSGLAWVDSRRCTLDKHHTNDFAKEGSNGPSLTSTIRARGDRHSTLCISPGENSTMLIPVLSPAINCFITSPFLPYKQT